MGCLYGGGNGVTNGTPRERTVRSRSFGRLPFGMTRIPRFDRADCVCSSLITQIDVLRDRAADSQEQIVCSCQTLSYETVEYEYDRLRDSDDCDGARG